MREQRLYAFVPYQLTGIQKGIQVAHALAEYQLSFGENENFKEWMSTYKTIIILAGGTTNEGGDTCHYNFQSEIGTMQEIKNEITEIGIPVQSFWEPDLNDALTAFVFIADEPIFNHDDFLKVNDFFKTKLETIPYLELFKNGPIELDEIEKRYPVTFGNWLLTLHEDLTEAKKLAVLKNYLSQFKLA